MNTAKFLFSFLIMTSFLLAQPDFNKFFSDKTLRIDYFHIGDSKEEIITIDQIYQYGIWAGSTKNLIDNFNNGRYYVKIYDAASNELIFSKGFDSYFGEYKTTSEAGEGIKRTYHESAIIPVPKAKIKFAMERRDKENILKEFYSKEIDPNDLSIIKEEPKDKSVKVIKSHNSGDPKVRPDIAILGEGYTAGEADKFKNDLDRFTKLVLSFEPYKSLKDKINIYGVYKPSNESGTDEPMSNIFKSTTLNTTFNSLGSERYLLTEDNRTMRDLAAYSPYDAIVIMVNHKRYGGGGIYNLFCTFTADNQWHDYLLLHEFGHSFAGLGDEYYTSDVAYDEFYQKNIEPVEPNITALAGNGLKWKNLLSENMEIPTPWEKEEFDKMDYKWQQERRELNKKVIDLKLNKAAAKEILESEEIYDQKDREHSAEVDKYLRNSKYWGKVGVFEGAGYSPKGLYRPMLDCIMFSKGKKPYCVVCEAAVKKVIQHYVD